MHRLKTYLDNVNLISTIFAIQDTSNIEINVLKMFKGEKKNPHTHKKLNRNNHQKTTPPQKPPQKQQQTTTNHTNKQKTSQLYYIKTECIG